MRKLNKVLERWLSRWSTAAPIEYLSSVPCTHGTLVIPTLACGHWGACSHTHRHRCKNLHSKKDKTWARHEPSSSDSPWFLLQIPAWVFALTSFSDGLYPEAGVTSFFLPFSCSWSWNFSQPPRWSYNRMLRWMSESLVEFSISMPVTLFVKV